MACVLDASFACQWLFRDEASSEGYAALERIGREGAVVPTLWCHEMTNVLGVAERRGRLTVDGVREALRLLGELPLTVDARPWLAESDAVLELMRSFRLSGFDAAYLALARRRGIAIAAKDAALQRAASLLGVASFLP